MLSIKLSSQCLGFLDKIPDKHRQQISKRILSFAENQSSVPFLALKGLDPYYRIKSGEYRVIFYLEDDIMFIDIIDKRNDDKVYKLLKRKV